MNDPLPKTACLHCIERLEAHHELMEKISFARQQFGIGSEIKDVEPTNVTVDTTNTSTSPPC